MYTPGRLDGTTRYGGAGVGRHRILRGRRAPLRGGRADIAVALQSPLPGAEYYSCGSNRSDTDSGRDLVIASDSLNIAAIIGDVACNSIVVILGEGSNLPGCIIAGVLHEAV